MGRQLPTKLVLYRSNLVLLFLIIHVAAFHPKWTRESIEAAQLWIWHSFADLWSLNLQLLDEVPLELFHPLSFLSDAEHECWTHVDLAEPFWIRYELFLVDIAFFMSSQAYVIRTPSVFALARPPSYSAGR